MRFCPKTKIKTVPSVLLTRCDMGTTKVATTKESMSTSLKNQNPLWMHVRNPDLLAPSPSDDPAVNRPMHAKKNVMEKETLKAS